MPASAIHEVRSCFHCGTPCHGVSFFNGNKAFCCQGCLAVFELLTANGLSSFYALAETAGVRVKATAREDQFKFLDEPAVRERFVSFADERITRVALRIPAIHCIACVWLLENLFKLKPGIGHSRVNFPRKELTITFESARVKLSEVIALLASLGYEPELKLSDLDTPFQKPVGRRIWMQLGLAGFAFGNLMLFSIANYLGLDHFSGPAFKKLVSHVSLLLAIPVVIYSALDYWRAAWTSIRQKVLSIEVPIAVGIVAIFTQSSYEAMSGRGDGYFDSLCGLIFFLLCGRLFQQKTYDRLSFERDYKSFFPLSVTRRNAAASVEEQVALEQLCVGDRLVIRHGELIPADSKLIQGSALIDYSFVTGEADPVTKQTNDYLYAGGRQIGGAIEVEMVKAISQSYLTSLWNQEAFRKEKGTSLNTLINVFSRRFTRIVLAAAIGAAIFWIFRGDSHRAFKAFTSILIVACPCALALASPFTLGTAIRVLGRRDIFVKCADIIERLAQVRTIVFDKTGTLTAAGAGSITFAGAPLTEDEGRWIYSLARQSTHPLAVRIADAIAANQFSETVRSFVETTGCGLEGIIAGHEIWLGSKTWLDSRGMRVQSPSVEGSNSDETRVAPGSVVHFAINRQYRGAFVLEGSLRPQTGRLIERLSSGYKLALLSGDNERERDRFVQLFGATAHLQFNQSALNKLEFIRNLQRLGQTVMMVGDGLNDAGALKQSDVGVAVVEKISAFSPASDVIMSAAMVAQIHSLLRFSKNTVRVVRLSFLISSLYNIVGIGIAAAGLLAPIVCAILMPLSSITVVAFACGVTTWAGRRAFADRDRRSQASNDPDVEKMQAVNAGFVAVAAEEAA